jgi:hypothetical protein
MIGNLDEEEFVKIQNLSPTGPVQLEENLYGREKQLRIIKQAFYAPGRSVFIHGDRGVGKTSLAQTVAYKQQSSSRDPVFLACSPDATFRSIMRDAITELQNNDANRSSKYATAHKGTLGLPGVASYQVHITQARADSVPELSMDLNRVVAILSDIGAKEDRVVVIDEFDRIASDAERSHFADFIKQIGDQRIGIRFVFCGVGESLEKLLGAHASCYRYLESVELPRLSWDARWAIIDRASSALNVSVGDRARYRIAAISDGFPHYVHLVCEKLFWEMFEDPQSCATADNSHYTNAVAAAVLGIEQHLKQAYDAAVMQQNDGYEEVLWAVADHSDLIRRSDSIYDSYSDIMNSSDFTPLSRTAFAARMRKLKSDDCGSILTSNRPGYFHFRESIVRGYVRLRAEEKGVELALEYQPAKGPQYSWRQKGARRPAFGTTPEYWRGFDDDSGS